MCVERVTRACVRTHRARRAGDTRTSTPVAKKERERERKREREIRNSDVCRRRRACVPLVIVLVARVLPCNDVGH